MISRYADCGSGGSKPQPDNDTPAGEACNDEKHQSETLFYRAGKRARSTFAVVLSLKFGIHFIMYYHILTHTVTKTT